MTVMELMAKLGIDKSEFDRGVSEAESSGRGLQDSLTNAFDGIKTAAKTLLGAAIFKEMIDAARDLVTETARVGDTIDKSSQKLGLSRRAYQEWEYILSQNGASIENMSAAMRTMNRLIIGGTDEAAESFGALGLSMTDLFAMQPEQQFEMIVRAFQKMPAGAAKSALAVKIFGRGGMELLPLLNSSADSIDNLRTQAESLGLIMSDDMVDASVRYGDSLDTLNRTFNAFKYSIGAKILPILTTGFEKITSFAGKLRDAYDKRGLEGVWDTLVETFRNIKWPTWEDIKQGLINAWEAIKAGARKIMKLIFGESADGDIAWPTPKQIEEKVKAGLSAMWEGVKELARTILKLVFGEDSEGGIAFPTPKELWDKIKLRLSDLWEGIKGLATGILKFVFGEDAEGGITFPTAKELWDKIKSGFTAMWEGVKPLIRDVADWLLGALGFPSVRDIETQFSDWWNNDIKPKIKSAAEWLLGTLGLPDPTKTIEKIKKWWNEKILPLLDLSFWFSVKMPGIDTSNTPKQGEGKMGGTGMDANQFAQFQADNPLYNFSNAKGQWDVPYDEYMTKLHRGEMVLSASRARRYREGEGERINSAGLREGIVMAIREGMSDATVNSYMDGKRMNRENNRITGRALLAGRYAP